MRVPGVRVCGVRMRWLPYHAHVEDGCSARVTGATLRVLHDDSGRVKSFGAGEVADGLWGWGVLGVKGEVRGEGEGGRGAAA
eukprot:scaffold4725_cov84-Isochrysis_galbana.AAC.1